MKFTITYLVLVLLAAGSSWANPALPLETDLDGFIHEITEKPGTDEIRTRQWVYPLQVRTPIPGGTFEVHSALMQAEQRRTVSPDSVAVIDVWGPLDTRFTGAWRLGTGGLISLHATLPTGKDSLNADEEALVRTIARNDLNFPVNTFGAGFDFGGGLSFATQRGHIGYSAGIAYVRRGEYDPVTGVANYKPGDEATLTLGIDYTWRKWVLRLSTVGSYYLKDRLGGRDIFRNGKQLMIQSGAYYEGRKLRLEGEFYSIIRFKNEQIFNDAFLYEIHDSNGEEYRLGMEVSWIPTRFLSLFGRAHVKHVTENKLPRFNTLYRGRARMFGVGGGMSISLNRAAHLVFRANRWSGHTRGGIAKLSAFNLKAALSIRL